MPIPKVDTLVELLRWRAQQQPHKVAYTFLADGETNEISLTYQELDYRAKTVAAQLQQMGLTGTQALLLYPPGLDYIAAFFGCLYAGVVAVPVYPPRRNRADPRLQAISGDSKPTVALTTTNILAHQARIAGDSACLQQITWLNTTLLADSETAAWQEPDINPDTLAILQYTSGSTGTPKGVMISHRNLLYNERMMQAASAQNEQAVMVGWLPFYHDMGLIGNLLYPFYMGIRCVFMAPAAFIQKPVRWLEAISRYRGTVNPSPNFGYQLCVDRITSEELADVDLSCWEVAVNGAEPIRAETLTDFTEKFGLCGFRYEAFHCCYGLAESTVFVSAGYKLEAPKILWVQADALECRQIVPAPPANANPGDAPDRITALVGCGHTWLDQRLIIVDPVALTICPESMIGEVWLASSSVGQGYWNRPAETKATFQAYLADTGEGPFLRTGDLGFLQEGQLYITGRLKDLIIIRGRNYYPQDIELIIEKSHPALNPGGGAVFSIDPDKQEALVVVQEIERTHLRRINLKEVAGAIRRVVSDQYQLKLHTVLLLKPLSLPKTSSGKIQRYLCREQFLKGELQLRVVKEAGI